MTIFDIIRYPISDHPTDKELDAIPSGICEIFNKIAEYTKTEKEQELVSLLRKVILEYEEDSV